jgi:transcriptional regulator with XRE-family HTH domain
MRNDLRLNQTDFAKRFGIPLRTLQSWEIGEREAPDYVIDLLGRAAYADLTGKKPEFYVVSIGKHDEWTDGHLSSYLSAIKAARENLEKSTVKDLHVEIRLYVADVEDENCENFDCDLVTFEQ